MIDRAYRDGGKLRLLGRNGRCQSMGTLSEDPIYKFWCNEFDNGKWAIGHDQYRIMRCKRKGYHTRMIMRQTDEIDPRQIMQVDRRVRQPGPRDPRSEMDMVARVEEIL